MNQSIMVVPEKNILRYNWKFLGINLLEIPFARFDSVSAYSIWHQLISAEILCHIFNVCDNDWNFLGIILSKMSFAHFVYLLHLASAFFCRNFVIFSMSMTEIVTPIKFLASTYRKDPFAHFDSVYFIWLQLVLAEVYFVIFSMSVTVIVFFKQLQLYLNKIISKWRWQYLDIIAHQIYLRRL